MFKFEKKYKLNKCDFENVERKLRQEKMITISKKYDRWYLNEDIFRLGENVSIEIDFGKNHYYVYCALKIDLTVFDSVFFEFGSDRQLLEFLEFLMNYKHLEILRKIRLFDEAYSSNKLKYLRKIDVAEYIRKITLKENRNEI